MVKLTTKITPIILLLCFSLIITKKLIFDEEFDKLNFKTWRHDITLSGGGNWEFELYHNNRTNSYCKNSTLYINPTLTEDQIGPANLRAGYTMDFWGGSPADQCTGNNFYGCSRQSGGGGNIINPIQSAKLTTVNSFSFKYGQVEIRAKLPKGDWIWPAMWLLPVNNEYGKWPASGEIDMVESRGNLNYPKEADGGVESFGSTLHWGPDFDGHKYLDTHNVYTHDKPLSDDFHIYGLYWDEERLYTYIDSPSNIVLDVDMKTQSFWERGQFPSKYNNPWQYSGKNAPFDTEYYFVLNVAVGGTVGYFKDGVAGKPWNDKSPNAVNDFYNAKGSWFSTWNGEDSALKVDYIKVWSLTDSEKLEFRNMNKSKFNEVQGLLK